MPSEVNSVKAISATSFGSTQFTPRRASRGTSSKGESLRASFLKRALELREVAFVEAGADAAVVDELAVLPGAEQQRAEAVPLVGGRPAADDEFLPLAALDLEPGLACARCGRAREAFLETMPSWPAAQIACSTFAPSPTMWC